LPGDPAAAYPGFEAKDVDRLHAQAAWMAAQFPGRAWLGLVLLHRAFDEAHRVHGGGSRLAAPAADRRPRPRRDARSFAQTLQDTLTATRLNKPVAECGYGWRRTPSSTCARACAWRTSIRARR
jgi:error-prone DNA polymerase